MPWNFPFWQVFRFAIPSLTVGNGTVLKHASNVQGCAIAIEQCFIDAGYYENIFSNLCIPGSQVDTVIENTNIEKNGKKVEFVDILRRRPRVTAVY